MSCKDWREVTLYFPTANGAPVSPKKLTVVVAAPVALRRMNSVA